MSIDCKYSYYQSSKRGDRNYLYCSINNQVCPLVRFCPNENRILNIKGHENCKVRKEDEFKMPNGKSKVNLQDKGYLYVEIEDIKQVRKIKNPFDHVPKWVEVVLSEVDNQYYIKGFEPKIEIKEENVSEIEEEMFEPKKKAKQKKQTPQ